MADETQRVFTFFEGNIHKVNSLSAAHCSLALGQVYQQQQLESVLGFASHRRMITACNAQQVKITDMAHLLVTFVEFLRRTINLSRSSVNHTSNKIF